MLKNPITNQQTTQTKGFKKINSILIAGLKEEDYGLSKHKQDLVDNIDAWAMWISPPLFVLWNFAYWLFYQL